MELEDLGWNPALAAAFQEFRRSGRPGRVIAVDKNLHRVHDGEGEHRAAVSGHFRHRAEKPGDLPTVGDWVVLQSPLTSPAIITVVLPRGTSLHRKAVGRTSAEQPLAANVDTIVIVMGLDGDFSLRRLERALVLAEQSGAVPVVLLNKADLCDDAEARRRDVEAIARGRAVHVISALHGDGVDALATSLTRGRTLAMLGSSGAGKSTLLNRLLGAPEQRTGEVRPHDDRGRHTTTSRQLFFLPGGASLIDSPGIRELQLPADDEAADAVFDDVAAIATACRFRDCQHEGEPGCAVHAAIEDGALPKARLESLRKLRREMRHQAEREDGALRREREAKWKAIHKAQKAARRLDR